MMARTKMNKDIFAKRKERIEVGDEKSLFFFCKVLWVDSS